MLPAPKYLVMLEVDAADVAAAGRLQAGRTLGMDVASNLTDVGMLAEYLRPETNVVMVGRIVKVEAAV